MSKRFKLVEVREAPPVAAKKLDDAAGSSQRRGGYSYARHTKLGKVLFIRGEGGETAKRRLPVSALAITLSESGVVFLADDKGRVLEILDGDAVDVMTVPDGEMVVHVFAAGDVVWVSHRAKVGAGIHHATPSTIARVARTDTRWQRTHTGQLPLKADSFAGNDSAVLVLDDDGDLSVLRCNSEGGFDFLGTQGENYTDVIELDGSLVGVSHWDKGARWVLEGVEAATPVAVSGPAEWRLSDLPAMIREGIETQLSDGANPLIHDARDEMKDSWSSERKEKHMKAAGRECWKAVSADVVGELSSFYRLEIGERLVRELEKKYVDLFEDAASWSDYD